MRNAAPMTSKSLRETRAYSNWPRQAARIEMHHHRRGLSSTSRVNWVAVLRTIAAGQTFGTQRRPMAGEQLCEVMCLSAVEWNV